MTVAGPHDRQMQSAHPSAQSLALYATSDLPWTHRIKVRHHIWQCSQCEEQVAEFRSSLTRMKHQASSSMLTGFEAVVDWQSFEREMLGNIAVGVAAARCIDNVGRHRWLSHLFSRGVLISAGLAIVFVAGWFTHVPSEQNAHLMSSLRHVFGIADPQLALTTVQAMPDGIAVRTQGATLTLRHPTYAINSLSGASAVTARYVDEDTGQVTITKVYGQ